MGLHYLCPREMVSSQLVLSCLIFLRRLLGLMLVMALPQTGSQGTSTSRNPALTKGEQPRRHIPCLQHRDKPALDVPIALVMNFTLTSMGCDNPGLVWLVSSFL